MPATSIQDKMNNAPECKPLHPTSVKKRSHLAMPSLYDCDETETETTDEIDSDIESQDDTASSSCSSSSSYASAEEGDIDDSCSLDSFIDIYKKGKRGVTWSPTIVTETRYRPTVTPEQKALLHYTGADMAAFRQQYKAALRAAIKFKKDKERQEEMNLQQQSLAGNVAASYQSPLSGMINRLTFYLSKPAAASPLSTSTSSTVPKLSGNSISRKSLETTLLVDTLYLF